MGGCEVDSALQQRLGRAQHEPVRAELERAVDLTSAHRVSGPARLQPFAQGDAMGGCEVDSALGQILQGGR